MSRDMSEPDNSHGDFTVADTAAYMSEDSWTVYILVPSSDVGAVIGHGGASIRRIRSESRIRVQISDLNSHPQLTSSERLITLTGKTEGILSAMKLISVTIENELAKHHQQSESNTTSGSAAPQNSPRPVTLKLVTDNSQIGCVIGRGGETIREIRASSGASIHIESETVGRSTSKRINASGNSIAVYKALSAIWSRLRASTPRGIVVPFMADTYLQQQAQSSSPPQHGMYYPDPSFPSNNHQQQQQQHQQHQQHQQNQHQLALQRQLLLMMDPMAAAAVWQQLYQSPKNLMQTSQPAGYNPAALAAAASMLSSQQQQQQQSVLAAAAAAAAAGSQQTAMPRSQSDLGGTLGGGHSSFQGPRDRGLNSFSSPALDDLQHQQHQQHHQYQPNQQHVFLPPASSQQAAQSSFQYGNQFSAYDTPAMKMDFSGSGYAPHLQSQGHPHSRSTGSLPRAGSQHSMLSVDEMIETQTSTTALLPGQHSRGKKTGRKAGQGHSSHSGGDLSRASGSGESERLAKDGPM